MKGKFTLEEIEYAYQQCKRHPGPMLGSNKLLTIAKWFLFLGLMLLLL